MKRTLPLCLLGGCLWIGPDTHDERLAVLEIGASVAHITPEAWSTCTSTEVPSFTVTLEVAAHHAGERFDAWAQLEGGSQIAVGSPTASDAATVEVTLDGTIGLDEVACTGTCAIPVRVGLERAGETNVVEVELVLLGDTPPALGSGIAVATSGVPSDLATAPTQDSPPSSLSSDDWPAIGFTLVDPHVTMLELGGDRFVAVCPPGTSPETAALQPGPCTHVQADRAPAFDAAGAAAFVAASDELGPLGCEAAMAGTTVELHAVVSDHTCGGSYAFALTTGTPLVVAPDCDADLASWPADCDDLDPEVSPSATESWYDGVDSDCSGGSDDDQDGDGVDALGHGGTDCDDLDGARFPDADEICDGRDNNCDGAEAANQATLTGAAGVVNLPTIQEALDLAVDGDTVTVCDGRYTGAFTARSDVTLTCGSEVGGACTLEAGGPGLSVLTLGLPGDALNVVVSHLTITGASGVAEGGGIDAREASTLGLHAVVLTGNAAVSGGGLAAGGMSTLTDVEIRDNTATSTGGGILLVGDATLDLDGTSIVSGNEAPLGGGLYAEEGVTVQGGGSFLGNAADVGGAIALRGTAALTPWAISDVTFSSNTADDGAAIDAAGDGTSLTLTTVSFVENTAVFDGGALAVESNGDPFVLVITTSTFTANEADRGGALAANDTEVTVSMGTWSANDGDNRGGAAYLTGGSTFVTDGTEFADNTAELGGAVYTEGSAVDLTDGTLTDNVAVDKGGGLYLLGGATVFLRGAIQVDGNLAGIVEQGAYVEDEQLVACIGAQVLDPITNSAGAFSPAADCFEVTAQGFDATQCTGC